MKEIQAVSTLGLVGRPKTEEPDDKIQLVTVFRQDCIETIPGQLGMSLVLSLLVQSLVKANLIPDERKEGLVAALLERERHGTTAIGKGLAFPHLRTDVTDHIVGAIGLAPDGIHFSSLDRAPTKLILLVLSPREQRERYFTLMARLAGMMRDTKLTLLLRHRMSPLVMCQYLRDFDARS